MTFNLKTAQIQVNAAFVYACPKNWEWDTASDIYRKGGFDLWTIIGGEGTLRSGSSVFRLSEGDCFLLRPDERYFATHDPCNPLILYPVHFDFIDRYKRRICPPAEKLPVFYRHIGNIVFLKNMIERIQINIEIKRNDLASEWLRIILLELDSWNISGNIRIFNSKRLSKLYSLKEDVMLRPEKYKSVGEMSREMKISNAYFSRLFRKTQGISANEFLISARIEVAKKLLTMSNDTISEIADKVGYSSTFFFSRQFKQKTGKSPKKYRQTHFFIGK